MSNSLQISFGAQAAMWTGEDMNGHPLQATHKASSNDLSGRRSPYRRQDLRTSKQKASSYHGQISYFRRTPHPATVTAKYKNNYTRLLLYSYYSTITGQGALLNHTPSQRLGNRTCQAQAVLNPQSCSEPRCGSDRHSWAFLSR